MAQSDVAICFAFYAAASWQQGMKGTSLRWLCSAITSGKYSNLLLLAAVDSFPVLFSRSSEGKARLAGSHLSTSGVSRGTKAP